MSGNFSLHQHNGDERSQRACRHWFGLLLQRALPLDFKPLCATACLV